ncbi:peroxidase 72 [Phtheirospermum japonicum]|uniref:Peroxidase n=1 Tax=Phtheirospermum japonicum TaxID=374723 RepID=A0A830DD95_9LAMI|nr:peroxidase 72 [Phtheirospermum japonicum]
MANSDILFMVFLALLAYGAPLCFSNKAKDTPHLDLNFYNKTCPKAQEIVKSVVENAVKNNPRMAASLLRLHFHDCFVKGCDASLLLDTSGSMISEQESNPNNNSALGFDVIDNIKSELEKKCPLKVSCADILALAARDSTVMSGGPHWEVPLGRKDSETTSLSGSNNNIPAPNNTFNTILTKFKLQGLNLTDLVALSGSHTIGKARCVSFRQRLYNQSGKSKPDSTLNQSYARELIKNCPPSGHDENLFDLDPVTNTTFDNNYFKNLLSEKGLLNSDQVLVTKNNDSLALVRKYANDSKCFFDQFAISMVKMGNIAVPMGPSDKVRQQCGKVNAA